MVEFSVVTTIKPNPNSLGGRLVKIGLGTQQGVGAAGLVIYPNIYHRDKLMDENQSGKTQV